MSFLLVFGEDFGLHLVSDWTQQRAEAVKAVLSLEYMSSDESDISEDEAGQILRGYKIKLLSWERSRLAKVKKDLDDAYYKSLKRRTRASVLQRTRHSDGSSRPPTTYRCTKLGGKSATTCPHLNSAEDRFI